MKDSQDHGGQSSGEPEGVRGIWDIIWKANIPQKIKIFAWRAATNSLAVQMNRVKHHRTDSCMCSICGVEDEDIVHALVSCSKAHALRMAVRERWNISDEEFFKCMGLDWLLILPAQLGLRQREQILFLFWRA